MITLEQLIGAIEDASYDVNVLTDETCDVYDGERYLQRPVVTNLSIIDSDKLLEILRALKG